jgi:cation diffusion facilitator CzcD-associated flavoprotein CzcO
MTLFAAIAGGTLLLFAAVDPGAGGLRTRFLLPLMVMLLIGSGGIISMLSPYTAEVYPTRLRGTGSGFAAGASKVGGILAPPLVAFTLLHHPGFGWVGVIAAAPVLLSMAMIGLAGIETRDRPLEEMQESEPETEREGSQTARSGRWLPGAATPPSPVERPATSHTRSAHAMSQHHEYLVIGAGPAGVQMGYYLQRHGRDYRVLEGGSGPGAFYQHYPRHRQMISNNKVWTGSSDPEFNLRHDWNSLLSDGQGPLFREHTTEYFPPADALLSYLQDFVARHGIRVQYHTRVARISRNGDGFAVDTTEGERFTCDRLVVSTGLSRPYIPDIPGIELVEGYEDMSVDPADFVDQRVLVMGKGNSGFETANHLVGAAALIHIVSPDSVQMAWKTHYVGHLRALNNDFLDTYQLKSQNAVLDATIQRIRRLPDGRLGVTFAYAHAEGEVEELPYDRVLRCTGFRFDASIFDAGAMPELAIHDRFPALTPEWESVNQPGMFFAGTIMQSQGYKKSTSGFIHGFRYNVRTLHHILAERFHGQPYPSETLPFEAEALAGRVLERVNRGSDIWQQQGYMADALLVGGDGTVEWREALPLGYISARHGGHPHFFVLTLEFGKHNNLQDPFSIPRSRSDDHLRASDSAFLHPVIREFQDGRQVSEHHIIEHLEARWRGPEHVDPLLAYFHQRVANGKVAVGRIVAAEEEEGELQPAAD